MTTPIASPPVVAADVPIVSDANLRGARDFDFFIGNWRVQHRRFVRQPDGSQTVVEFDGTASMHTIMDGFGNVDENVLNAPKGTYRASTVRAYNVATGLWRIWWIDLRSMDRSLDSVAGKFEHGVGTFYGDDVVDGKPIRVRFLWTHATPTSCRWEQAFSRDGGTTWATDWIMEFQRV